MDSIGGWSHGVFVVPPSSFRISQGFTGYMLFWAAVKGYITNNHIFLSALYALVGQGCIFSYMPALLTYQVFYKNTDIFEFSTKNHRILSLSIMAKLLEFWIAHMVSPLLSFHKYMPPFGAKWNQW